jgi:hypothetical protein
VEEKRPQTEFDLANIGGQMSNSLSTWIAVVPLESWAWGRRVNSGQELVSYTQNSVRSVTPGTTTIVPGTQYPSDHLRNGPKHDSVLMAVAFDISP